MSAEGRRERILVVEDHEPTRRGVARALERRTRFAALTAATLAEARRHAAAGPVAFALIDLQLGPESGVDVIGELASRAIPCVAFTVCDDEEHVLAALAAGARGYLLKSDGLPRIVRAVEEVLAGHAPLSLRVAGHVVRALQPDELRVHLTPREKELLVCLARGLTYPECAEALGVGLGTVQGYVKTLYPKLDVGTKAEAATWAHRHGLVR